jgi:hypothetical protein
VHDVLVLRMSGHEPLLDGIAGVHSAGRFVQPCYIQSAGL